MRPLRAKHDPILNQCVARFDHHCPWVRAGVGFHNHPWFLAYTGFCAATLFLQVVLCLKYLYNAEHIYSTPTVLFTLCACCGGGLFAALMFGSHVYGMVVLNMTTNEGMNRHRASVAISGHHERPPPPRRDGLVFVCACVRACVLWRAGAEREAPVRASSRVP
jgi:hypothetical protein